jgi:putative component of toxin-antitoxin plasmid stabilization module
MSNQVHQVDCGFIRVDNMVLGGYGDAVVIRDGTMEVRTVQDEVPYDFKGMDS